MAADKYLNDAEWQKFSKGRDLKEGPLLKALAAINKVKQPADMPDVLDEVEKQAELLRKAGKGDKELIAFLDGLDKSLDKERKLTKAAIKEAEASEDEEEESPILLTTKMIPLLRQVKKGDEMQVMVATTGKDVAVLISRRSIAPTKRKLLTEYLGVSGGVKIILGTCIFEEKAYTFVVQSQAAGLAKKLKAALLKQTELRLKVRVRGDSPDDIDDDGEEAEAEEQESGETASSSSAPTAPTAPTAPAVDPLKQDFTRRWAEVQPRVLQALRAQSGDAGKIRALAEFVQGKSEADQYKAALQGLDSLVKLLDAAPQPATAPTVAPTPTAPSGDPMAAFKTRLATLMGQLKIALEAGREGGADQRTHVAEAGALAQKQSFEAANALLDQVEAWLDAAPSAAPTSEGAGMVALQTSRLAWDDLRKKMQADLQSLEKALVAGVRAHNNAAVEDSFTFDEGELTRGLPRLYSVLAGLDERLIDKLDDALNASGSKRQALQQDAAKLVSEYRKFVDSDPLIAVIDDNGFVSTSIRSEARRTLDKLAAQL